MRQDFIHQQGGAICHPPCATTGAEAASLTAESDQFFIVARLTPYPEKAMLKPSTLQVFIKFFRYISWQEPALTGQLGLKLRPVFPYQLVK
jgi:hypothetical protein